MSLDRYFDGAILLPVDDLAAITVGDHRARLAERFRVPASTDGVHRRLISKRQMNETCRELGLAIPRSMSADSMTSALDAASQLGYPVVLKRDDAFAASAPAVGGRSVVVAPDEPSLRTLWPQMSRDGDGAALLVQEYLDSQFATVWMFNGYFDSASRCLGAFTGVKLRQSPFGAGPTTLGVCRQNSELTAIATGLLRELGYSGIVDMDFCYDARDRRYKLLDVNPRLGGTFRLFASGSLDVVRALHLDLSGRPVPSAPCLDGRKWLDEAADLSACNELLRTHRFSFASWGRSLSGVRETAWWARDDPRPFLAMTNDLAVRVGRRISRRRSVSAAGSGRG